MAKNLLQGGCECWHDAQFRDGTGSGDGGAAEAGEIVAVGARDTLDEAEIPQAAQLARQGCRGKMGQQADQVGAAHAVDIELRPLQCAQQLLLGALEEVQSLDRAVCLALLLGQAIQSADAGGVILDGGEELEVPAIAPEEDFAQIDPAVDRLLQGCQFTIFLCSEATPCA